MPEYLQKNRNVMDWNDPRLMKNQLELQQGNNTAWCDYLEVLLESKPALLNVLPPSSKQEHFEVQIDAAKGLLKKVPNHKEHLMDVFREPYLHKYEVKTFGCVPESEKYDEKLHKK